MKKIPTLFVREFKNHKVVGITPIVTEGLEWVLGKATPTVKWDGSCCAVINGELYKRYDAKKGKKPPEGAIPCCDPDPITGHWPHWVKVSEDYPGDKWFVEAYNTTKNVAFGVPLEEWTYEAIGKHFNGNPYEMEVDFLMMHGLDIIDDEVKTFEQIRDYLRDNVVEGIVFWYDGEPICKIKRSDFGFDWPLKKEGQ